jgi:hypothetical protein
MIMAKKKVEVLSNQASQCENFENTSRCKMIAMIGDASAIIRTKTETVLEE